MGTEKPNPGGRPSENAPGKPGSRQPPDVNTGIDKDGEEGQEIPKTGRDDRRSDDLPADDDDELGNVELPREGDERSRPAGNP
jgi:hypothetical protein